MTHEIDIIRLKDLFGTRGTISDLFGGDVGVVTITGLAIRDRATVTIMDRDGNTINSRT